MTKRLIPIIFTIVIATLSLRAGMPEVDKYLIGTWEIDLEHGSLDSLDETGRKMLEAFFGDFNIQFAENARTSARMMGRDITGFFQMAGKNKVFCLFSHGEYTSYPFTAETPDAMHIDIGSRNNKSLPLKRTNDISPNIPESVEEYERLEIPTESMIAKTLNVKSITKGKAKPIKLIAEGSHIVLNEDHSRYRNVLGMETTDRWEYDAGSRTMYWGSENNGVFLHLIKNDYPTLTFKAGADGPEYDIVVE